MILCIHFFVSLESSRTRAVDDDVDSTLTPEIQQNGCDAATKADLDAFFDPLTSQLEGLPRELREANDQIDRCIAFKNAKATEIAAALGKSK